MTLSPERKAEKIVKDIFESGSRWGEHDWEMAERLIATAIRHACNEKLEEAARDYDEEAAELKGSIAALDMPASFKAEIVNVLKSVADGLRSLKDTSP